MELVRASPEQAPILANLLELYVHDFSEFVDLHLGQDGRFGYEKLPLYWTEPGRHPFLAAVDGRWAGFVLVKLGSEVSGDDSAWDMAEFFILRGYRRRGTGSAVAQEVWRRLPGPWEVRVMERHLEALRFWERAIGRSTGATPLSTRFEKRGESWRLFSFVSSGSGEESA